MFVQMAAITGELLFVKTAYRGDYGVNTTENEPLALFMRQNP